MPKDKKDLQSRCPHKDCGAYFLEPIIKKGILFCPHCERSLLVEAPLSLDEVNQQNKDSHKKRKALSYNLLITILIVAPMLIASIYGGAAMMSLYVAALYLGMIIYRTYKSSRESVEYRLKHHKIKFVVGVDRIEDINKFSEIKMDYADQQGILTNSHYYPDKIEVPTLSSCPCCTSQMIVKLPEMIGWHKNLYAKYHISHPTIIPNTEYCPMTGRYVNTDLTLSNILLCLHCHTHYSWADIETGDLFKSVEGAPQLHKI